VDVAEPPAARVGTVRPRTSLIKKCIAIAALSVPPCGIFLAMGLLWGVAFHWVDVILLVAMYTVCSFGITVGFHRYFAHRSFETRPPVKAALAILGSMTVQGPLAQWVTDHRKHHAFSDRTGDPHSPHVGHPEGLWGGFKGFVHAQFGWLFSNLGMEQGRDYGKDLYEDRLVVAIDRLNGVWVVLTLGIPFAIGYWAGGTVGAGLEGLVWGGLIRVFLFHHATWTVNSLCHMFGRREYPVRDESRNNWFVSLLVFGEGWHNNHHAFPSSARHGFAWWQYDLSWWLIRGLEKIHLVSDVKLPSAEQRRRRAAALERQTEV
jgi:stearoyl-CoA desaturase (delta-9 desaturase)